MKMHNSLNDLAILIEIGSRFERERLNRNLSQAQLAELAGVSKSTIERLESGSVAVQLSGFIRVCRALDFIERLDAAFPEQGPSPMALLKLRDKSRKRAYRAGASKKKPETKWEWDEKP